MKRRQELFRRSPTLQSKQLKVSPASHRSVSIVSASAPQGRLHMGPAWFCCAGQEETIRLLSNCMQPVSQQTTAAVMFRLSRQSRTERGAEQQGGGGERREERVERTAGTKIGVS